MGAINVVLFTGGDSGEYEISLGSAAQVAAKLNPAKYNVYTVLVKSGRWSYTDADGTEFPFDRNYHCLFVDGKVVKFDCAFIAIHGTPGEDGKLQGYLEMAGIPYTTCDVTTSAITFNKYFSNDLAKQYGVNVASTIVLQSGESWNAETLCQEMGLPCFVKPNKGGSSVGVTKVYDAAALPEAIAKAFAEDDEVLVQQFIKGREMTCGVYTAHGEIQVLPVTEIVSKNDFFDYQAKYTASLVDEITPAPIEKAQSDECQRISRYLYRKFNCRGIVRFDYFLADSTWWFLEVNTIPGMSAESIVPKQLRTSGIDMSDFFGGLIDETLRRK